VQVQACVYAATSQAEVAVLKLLLLMMMLPMTMVELLLLLRVLLMGVLHFPAEVSAAHAQAAFEQPPDTRHLEHGPVLRDQHRLKAAHQHHERRALQQWLLTQENTHASTG
jgi:hypothetical protein